MTAVDYSGARYTAQQLKAHGIVAVGRYITGPYAISQAELEGLVAGGIVVWLVFEANANDVAGGAPAGAAHAQQVNTALRAIGLSVTQPVYFAADEDLPTPQSAVAYYQGIAAVRAASTNGDYGEGALCELLAGEGLTAFHWQSESTAFPGNASTLPITNIQQKVGGGPLPDTDLDILCKADFGQYPRPFTPPPTPAPVPNTRPQEVIMGLPSGCTDAGAVTSQIREWWNLYRTDPMTGAMQQVCAGLFNLPTTSSWEGVQGFGGNPDALQAFIVDGANSAGTLRPQYVNAV